MADVPHIALPFQFVAGTVAVVEQDSADEIAQCARTVMRYHVGERNERPEFGIPDLAFTNPNLQAFRTTIETLEPRAIYALTDSFISDNLEADVNVDVRTSQ